MNAEEVLKANSDYGKLPGLWRADITDPNGFRYMILDEEDRVLDWIWRTLRRLSREWDRYGTVDFSVTLAEVRR